MNNVHAPAWQSIQRYRSIEATSGIDFYTESGYINIITESSSTDCGIKAFHTTAKVKLKSILMRKWLRFLSLFQSVQMSGNACNPVDESLFPQINWPQDAVAYHQPNNAGHINPRLDHSRVLIQQF